MNSSLRRLHVVVLVTLVLSAALVALGPISDPPPGPSPGYSLAALLIACVSIFARRQPGQPFSDVRPILRRAIVGLAFAGLLGPLGVLIALREGAQTTGLLYSLAGAFLSLRPPPEVVLRNGYGGLEE
jgi:drug/metabolite transporter (DMT)-like permease